MPGFEYASAQTRLNPALDTSLCPAGQAALVIELKNTSADQTVRLIGGTIRYIDSQGRAIKLEEARTEPTFKFSGYGAAERLDPGQDATQAVNVDFPALALKSNMLKEIRLELIYLPSAYKQETSTVTVAISGQ